MSDTTAPTVPTAPIVAPSSESITRPPLFARPVLLATDGTNAAGAAVRFTGALARNRHAAPLVLTVLPPLANRREDPAAAAGAPTDQSAEAERRGRQLRDIREHLGAFGGRGPGGAVTWPVDLAVGRPAATIVQEARRRDVGSIVVGLRRHGTLDRLFRDETALIVVRTAAVPVLAIAPTLTDLPRCVIAAVDFSRASLAAARAAASVLADGATLLLVHVQPEMGSVRAAAGYGTAYSQGVGSAFTRLHQELDVPAGVAVEPVLLRGDATTELLALADRVGADLIAVGGQSQGPDRLSLESVTRSLVREGRVSLLVVPPSHDPAPHAAVDARTI